MACAFLLAIVALLSACAIAPVQAFADGSTSSNVVASAEGDSAISKNASFGITGFERAQKGTNRALGGAYRGYAFLSGSQTGRATVVDADDYAVVYVPADVATNLGISIDDEGVQTTLRECFCTLDATAAMGSQSLSSVSAWHYTTDKTYAIGTTQFSFDAEYDGCVYAIVSAPDGSDMSDSSNPYYHKIVCADFATLAPASDISLVAEPSVFEKIGTFLSTLDWSPLWVTLKTTGVAIVFIFILGLLAAYWVVRLPAWAQNVLDSIFTIPMVLPPTVCGFVLLYALGRNTPFGSWLIDVGFPLVFSWPATVIAAVVVAFPLMYRNARGAFESLNTDMLDAARTLGWSNARIFFRLMLPLSWSSIAAGTVLAFARALGEFGATLFLAGNYLGVTRTVPIAIYFEWMNGNDTVAWFWTGVIIVVSFAVILCINLLSLRTTKFRRKVSE